MARRDGMRRPELIFLHSASADGCNAWHVLDEIPEQQGAINGTMDPGLSAYFVVGLFFVFVDARQRRIETEKLQWHAATDD
jgi:hypothetical protein